MTPQEQKEATCDQCGEAWGEGLAWISLTRSETGLSDAWDATLCQPKCVRAFLEAQYGLAMQQNATSSNVSYGSP
jgi:hypothetical protein